MLRPSKICQGSPCCGCGSTPTVAVIDTSLTNFKRIETHQAGTCGTKRQAAAHNSVYDTLLTGKEVVYQNDCRKAKAKKKPAAKPVKKPEPKTS